MKFTIETSVIAKALKTVSKSVAFKTTLPSTEGVLIEALDNKVVFTGYNLEIAIRTVVYEAEIKDEGSIVVPFPIIDAIVSKAATQKIDFSTSANNSSVTLKSGKSINKISAFSSKEFPSLPTLDSMEEIVISGETIANAINHTSYACSNDVGKPIYTGSLFEFKSGVLTVVATDGYRIAIKRVGTENQEVETSVIIPHKAQIEVVRLLSECDEIKIHIGNRHLVFESENIKILTRILEGTFMDYNSIIPQKSGIKTTITVDKSIIYGAVDRLSLYLRDKVKSPTVVKIDNEISISIESTLGKGNETITALEATIDGEPVTIGLNNLFLINAIKAFDDGKIKIYFSGSEKPVVLCHQDDENTEMQIIVPMRLAKG